MKENVFTPKLSDKILPQENFSSVFLVVEYYENDICKLMHNSKVSFDEEHALTILYNLLCGVNFLHSANIMHRDLKPANILIDANCAISICDFGLARTIYPSPNQDNRLKRGATREFDVKHRNNSPVVMTRFYRAPEVILQQDYDHQVDQWSIGCIFAELIRFTNTYRDEQPDFQKRFLFFGKSCHPISPNEQNQVDKNDQLVKILEVLENPTNFGESTQFDMISKQVKQKISLGQLFDKSSTQFQGLLSSLVTFDPEERMTTSECLKNKIFDPIRQPLLEQPAKSKIYLKVDQENECDIREQIIQIAAKI